MFPGFNDFNKADLWHKRMVHEVDPMTGDYIGAIDRYKRSPLLPVHLDLFKSVVSNSQPLVLVGGRPKPMLAFGAPVREWKEKEVGKQDYTTSFATGLKAAWLIEPRGHPSGTSTWQATLEPLLNVVGCPSSLTPRPIHAVIAPEVSRYDSWAYWLCTLAETLRYNDKDAFIGAIDRYKQSPLLPVHLNLFMDDSTMSISSFDAWEADVSYRKQDHISFWGSQVASLDLSSYTASPVESSADSKNVAAKPYGMKRTIRVSRGQGRMPPATARALLDLLSEATVRFRASFLPVHIWTNLLVG